MTAADFISRLDAVRLRGTGKWSARCPAHPDKNPSLSIREGDDGRILLYCFAGCSPGAICEALGLRLTDLFPDVPADRETLRIAHTKLWRFDWRKTASDFLHHAEGLRLRAETVLDAARGLSTDGWSDTDLDAAMNAVCRVYGDLEWANVLEDVAFDLRVRGLTEEKERHESRRRAA